MQALHNARAVQFSVLYWVCVAAALFALTAYVSIWLAALLAVVVIVARVARRIRRGERVLGIQWIGRYAGSMSDGVQHPKYPWLKHSASTLVLLDKDAVKALKPTASKSPPQRFV